MILKKEEDAFGIALYNYVTGKDKHAQTVIEFDDGYIMPGTSVFFYSAALQYEKWMQCDKEPMQEVFGKVLDIGVGGAKFALYLQNKGFDITGIDISPYVIKACNKLGFRKAYLMDLFAVKKKQYYNTVLLMGNNFGIMESKEHAKKVLKKLYNITTDDCVILAQSMNPYKFTRASERRFAAEQRAKGRMPGQLRYRHIYEKTKGSWFYYLFVSPAEMKQLLKGSGFYIDNICFNKSEAGPYTAILKKS